MCFRGATAKANDHGVLFMEITDHQRMTLIRTLLAAMAVLLVVLIIVVVNLVGAGPSNNDRDNVKSFLVTMCCQTDIVSKVRERYDTIRTGLRGGNLGDANRANEAVASIIRSEVKRLGISKELLVRVAEPGGQDRHDYANQIADAVLVQCPQRAFTKDEVKRAARSILKMIDWKLFKFE